MHRIILILIEAQGWLRSLASAAELTSGHRQQVLGLRSQMQSMLLQQLRMKKQLLQ